MGIRGATDFTGSPFKYPRSDKAKKGHKVSDSLPGTGGSNVDSFMDGSLAEAHALGDMAGGKNIVVGGGG